MTLSGHNTLIILFYNEHCFVSRHHHDIENYQKRDLCFSPKLNAEFDNTNRGLDSPRYHMITKFNCIYFMIYSKKTRQPNAVV